MNPGSVKTMIRIRRVGLYLLVASPVVVLAAVWLIVTQVLMAPPVPDDTTPPDQVAQFMMHPKGMPRLGQEGFESFLRELLPRLASDDAYRERFLAEIRTASPDGQQAFRNHLFDGLKPRVMADIRGYHATPDDERAAYLDDRIVEYNRLKALGGDVSISKGDLFGAAAPSGPEVLQWLMNKTTEEERAQGATYLQALAARVQEILADPELKAEIEARIGIAPEQAENHGGTETAETAAGAEK